MSREYPFPLPEAIQKELDPIWDRLGCSPQCYLHGNPGEHHPQLLDAFVTHILQLSNIASALDLACAQVAGRNQATKLLFVILTALEAEVSRMNDILHWGGLTWKYDPAIRTAFNGDTLPPSDVPGSGRTLADSGKEDVV
jgi:hypothetical protein